MAQVAVIAYTDLGRDPRVHRQLEALYPFHEVTAFGLEKPVAPVTFVPLKWREKSVWERLLSAGGLLVRRYESHCGSHPKARALEQALQGFYPDICLVNDLDALPIVLRCCPNSRIIFDAHEYYPKEFPEQWLWRLFHQGYMTYLARHYMPQADVLITVSRGISKAYFQDLGREPFVMTNAPRYQQLEPQEVDPQHVKLVCHSAALPGRQLESLIKIVDFLEPRFTLDLILVPTNAPYFEKLHNLAAKKQRVRIRPPVAMGDIPSHLNHYDIGVYLLPPTSLNHRYALPNKFFEFIQARLALAIGPSPEMADLVQKYQCGVVAPNFSPQGLAQTLNQMTSSEIMKFKRGAGQAASLLTAEHNATWLQSLMTQL